MRGVSAKRQMPFEVVPFREEFQQDVARLLTAFFPDPADALAQFNWLVHRNPYSDAPRVYLALWEGRAVAMRVFHAARWEVAGFGQSFDVPCGVMFVTDKAFRRRGIGKLLMEGAINSLAANGITHLFSFAAAPIAYRVQQQQGWRPITHYNEVRHSIDSRRLRRSLGQRLPVLRNAYRWLRRRASNRGGRSMADQAQIFTALDANAPSSFEGGRLEVAKAPDATAMAALAGADKERGLIRHVRGPEYFNWRYQAPLMQNRILTWSQGDARGFLVLETRRDAAKPVRIVDWEATNDEALKRLFAAAIEFGQFRNLWAWEIGLSNDLTDFLDQSGFTEVTYDAEIPDYLPGLMVKALNDPRADGAWEIAGTSLVAPENWALRPAYAL